MSAATYCDHCGAHIKRYGTEKDAGGWAVVHTGMRKKDHWELERSKIFDLCPDCQTLLAEFFHVDSILADEGKWEEGK